MDLRQLIFPSGIGLTQIDVYQEPAADGTIGGSPHIHTVCSEIYYVLSGQGSVELLSFEGLSTVPLAPGKVVFFRPGVIHRLVNPNKDLKVLAIMQNGALPERGDNVMTFPVETMTNHTAYMQANRAPDHAAAMRRRDLSMQGYAVLRDTMTANADKGRELLRQFYRQCRNLMAPKVDGFEWVLQSGGQAEVKLSLDACDFLRIGRTDYLERAKSGAVEPKSTEPRQGMMGMLYPYALDEAFLPEGKKVA